ncbi:hypothetical protein CMI37_29705 [Candidatus Pacearchaeota archaeon]|nr:hypothetical protein [Candidatus Pacearchaeota archaeon]|tara:strand:+ start:976 stop:1275 length:300 start_codon:yes stop_codon:yes gene_type:complete
MKSEDLGGLKLAFMFLGMGMLFLGFFVILELDLNAQLETLIVALFWMLFVAFWWEWVTIIRVERHKPTSRQSQRDYKQFLAGLNIGSGSKAPRRRRPRL